MISKFYRHPIKYDLLSGAIQRFKGNVWYTVGMIRQRPEKGRGTEADVKGIPGLWMDIDVLGGVHKEENLPSKDEALSLLDETQLRPSILVWSGGGFQPYWIFKEPWIFDGPDDHENARQLSRRWQAFIIARAREKGWKLDNTASLEHLLRVPGTYNHKADPVPVKIMEMNDFRYQPGVFEDFLQDQPQREPGVSGKPVTDIGEGSGHIWEIVGQCTFLKHCRVDAGSLSEPEWWCMVCALCFEGGSRDAIHKLSEHYPQYQPAETNVKILEALKQSGPMTCQAIQEKTGFQCPPGGCGVKCPVHLLNGQRIEWEEPVLLDDFSLPKMEPVRGMIGDISKAVSDATETPLELATGMVLAAVATACQGRFIVQAKRGYSEPVNVWIVVALDSGNRKSSVLIEATRPLISWESQKRCEMEDSIKRASSKRMSQDARLKSLRAKYGKAKGGDLAAIEEEIQELELELVEIPIAPRVWCDDVTTEHLGTLMSIHNERMSVMSAEGGIIDTIAGRYSNGIVNMDLYLKGHSGDPARVDRGSRDPIDLKHPALTLGLSPQPDVLKNMANLPGFRGRGFNARCGFLLPKSKLGFRSLETEPVIQQVRDEYERVIHALLDIEPGTDEHGEPVPYILNLSRSAFQEWMEFSKVVELGLREGGRFEFITDWGGKLPGFA
ncbi:MAG: DUF3987 domain-containing protein, partial [Deltaproteobacteria bacterium]|nr:DUF3987 domain-containing protein [Deltaproteobacteria bacterium]